MKKIAFIVPYDFVPPKNGGHKAAFGFAEFLSKEEELICISTQNNEHTEVFRLERLLPNSPFRYFNPFLGWKTARHLSREQVNYCLFHQPFLCLTFGPFLYLMGIPFGIFVQNIEYQRFRSLKKWWWPLMYCFEWISFKWSRHLFFIAPSDISIAQKQFALAPQKCVALNYGTYEEEMPFDRLLARSQILEQHQFEHQDKLLLFFGPQSYQPNLEAVLFIIDSLYPKLCSQNDFSFQLLICGGGLPKNHRNTIEELPNFHYLGFVDEIEKYIKSADLMLNPICTGGGVKTKIIEAIALGTSVISFESGAIGIDHKSTGEKLTIVPNNHIEDYFNAIQNNLGRKENPKTPACFYDFYSWKKIAQQTLSAINHP